jgi:hypothetical protein
MINETDTTEINPFDEIDLDLIAQEPEDPNVAPNPFEEIDVNSDSAPFW